MRAFLGGCRAQRRQDDESWRQAPFLSEAALRDAFAQGLQELLRRDELGTFILAYANANFDPAIGSALQSRLDERFAALAQRCRALLREGKPLQGASDDVMVFLKLMAIGFANLRPREVRTLGPWELQFNHVRALRPARMSESRVRGVAIPFDPSGFNFNKPFLRKEVFWHGRMLGRDVELLYNKFPFVDLHALLVPNRDANEPQFLSRPYHLFVWELVERLAEFLPGVGFGYNSYGAFASVNHLHFQMFVRNHPLPISLDHWRHNGGASDYPVVCECLRSPVEAWERLHDLHSRELSYNLIYLPGALYCVPRRTQGTYPPAEWSGGFAWHEVAGGFTAFSREDYLNLDEDTLSAELASLRL